MFKLKQGEMKMVFNLTHIETKKDYQEFERRFKHFMKIEGLSNLSSQEEQPETYFSKRPCDCCDRPLGGDRIDCNGYSPTDKRIYSDYSVCVDCYYYAEYGTLDDMTMLEIEV